MNKNFTAAQSDIWSEWLLFRRYGNDEKRAVEMLSAIDRFADRVLEGARLNEHMTLVDIGSGDGLIAFKAIERTGPTLRAILTDISFPMLQHAEHIARLRNIEKQCSFLNCPADKLDNIGNSSVDVVTTRSVLAYVADKKAAMREFHRILKPGGRISIAEPIFRDEAFKIMAMKKWIDDHPADPNIRLLKIIYQCKFAQLPATLENISTNPLINYSERDLFNLASENNFTDIHLELHLNSVPTNPMSWEVYLDSSPHPLAPTIKEILTANFSPEDQALLEKSVRPEVEAGQSAGIERMAYLTAVKSSS